MQDLELYLNMPLPEREHSKYPRGFKHYSKEEISQNSAFDLALLWYRLKNLIFGGEQ